VKEELVEYLVQKGELLPVKRLAAQRLPGGERLLLRVKQMLESEKAKKIAVAAVGVSVGVSLLGAVGKSVIYRSAVAREVKKQLEPVNRKLDELQSQNTQLLRQNRELMEKLEAHQTPEQPE
jgi:hypothetical protein